ncbi:phosphate/phosphite/phosphonate ABC transporter substrate-binding protein [Haloarcula sp. S1AR25-5A]|uniref:Phosphate/phosphite/phosphonate ABC transporter substrate-binding protein n=1 Tax=Haloarcula terrestris TaxID=2950533 RepID=A0AAE4F1G5_9EURY|nr:phosphate/phosphite/phosphonate ABC transporter substrate-binding protein [Haloarcula terrestris]MDS0222808.1 phosphate/phosphite/phosphonate ABC transporter substrate-binding protein [Haloarcula terrestris]
MQPTRRGFLGTAAALSMAGCLGGVETPTVTVGIVPDVDPDTAIEQNTELAAYLSDELDVEIELRTAADYAGMVQAMVAGQVEIAYYGGVSYILAHHRAGATPVVVGSQDGQTEWHSVFIAPADGDLAGMEDVVETASETELVFGDPLSTSGTVMPTYHLRTEYDLHTEAFSAVTHVGAHDATAKTVSRTDGVVGALNARIYDRLLADGAIEGVQELWRTPGFPDYPWAVAPSLEATTADAVQAAFTSLDSKGRTDILDQQAVDRYVEVSHDAFTSLETAVEMAGIEQEGDG